MIRSAAERAAIRYRAHGDGLIPIDVLRALTYEERQRVMLMHQPEAQRVMESEDTGDGT
jgi:hypothetical protein